MNRGFGEGEGPCGTLTVIYEEIKGGKNRHMNRNTDFRIKPRILRVNIGRASAVIFFKDSDKFTVKIGIILRKGKLSFNWHPAPNDISFQDSISAEYQYELKILQFQPWKAGKRKKKKWSCNKSWANKANAHLLTVSRWESQKARQR